MMTIREYKRAESLEEAWCTEPEKAKPHFGRHDLAGRWKPSMSAPPSTFPVWDWIPLRSIEDSFSIGAMVTLRQLEQHPGFPPILMVLCGRLCAISGVQLRNPATVGGSIYSRFGFSDVLTMFLAMDRDVELYKGGILPLHEYAQRPYDRDVLVRLIVKTPMQFITSRCATVRPIFRC